MNEFLSERQEKNFEYVIYRWLKNVVDEVNLVENFPLRLSSKKKIVGDSGNYHEVDFVIEVASSPPENWKEMLNEINKNLEVCEEKSRVIEAYKGRTEIPTYREALIQHLKSYRQCEDSFNRLTNSFRYEAKILVEVKGLGLGGVKPSEQTYREHMLRAYAKLGDYRNQRDKQKYIVVTYRLDKKQGFDYDSYFKSIDATLISYDNPKEKEILEKEIKNWEMRAENY